MSVFAPNALMRASMKQRRASSSIILSSNKSTFGSSRSSASLICWGTRVMANSQKVELAGICHAGGETVLEGRRPRG
jgi:hypothetical protein